MSLFRLGLAAASLGNGAHDYRDTLIVLADLYVGAEEAGIDPRPHFDWAAGFSTDSRTPGGLESMAKAMRAFHSYAIVAERRSKGRRQSGEPES